MRLLFEAEMAQMECLKLVMLATRMMQGESYKLEPITTSMTQDKECKGSTVEAAADTETALPHYTISTVEATAETETSLPHDTILAVKAAAERETAQPHYTKLLIKAYDVLVRALQHVESQTYWCISAQQKHLADIEPGANIQRGSDWPMMQEKEADALQSQASHYAIKNRVC
eukprot:scaffold96204_cov18-Tisochrysis_lutea.AAC.1